MATLDDDIFNPTVARIRARLEAVGSDLSTVSNKDLLLRIAEETRQQGGLDLVSEKYGEGFTNQYLDIVNAPEPGREGFFGGLKEVPEGLGRGYEGLKSTALGGLGLAAGSVGLDGVEESLMESAAEAQQKASEYDPSISRASDVRWSNPGEVARFLAGAFGEALPSTVEAAGSFALGAGAGGLVGRQVVKSRLKETLQNVIRNRTGETAEEAIKRTFSMAGMQLGLGASSLGLGAGEIYSELYPYTQLNPSSDEYVDPSKAKGISIVFGTLAGSLDMMSAGLQLNKILGIGEEASERYLKRLLYNLPEGVVVEGATEAAQEFINISAEKYAKGREVTFSQEELDRMFDAGVLGAVGGTQFATAGAIRFGNKKDSSTGSQDSEQGFDTDEEIPDDFKMLDELDDEGLEEIEGLEESFGFNKGDPVVYKSGDGFRDGVIKDMDGSNAIVERTLKQGNSEIKVTESVPTNELFTGKYVPPEDDFELLDESKDPPKEPEVVEPPVVVTEEYRYGEKSIIIEPQEKEKLDKAIKAYEDSANKKNGISSKSGSPKKDFIEVTGLSKKKDDMKVYEQLKELGVLNQGGQINTSTKRDAEIEKQEFQAKVQKNKDKVVDLFAPSTPDGSKPRFPDPIGQRVRINKSSEPFVVTSYDPETGEMIAEQITVPGRGRFAKQMTAQKVRINSEGAFALADDAPLGRVTKFSIRGKMGGKGTEYRGFEAGTLTEVGGQAASEPLRGFDNKIISAGSPAVAPSGEFVGAGIFVRNAPENGQVGALGGLYDVGEERSIILQDPKVYDMKGGIPTEDDFYTAQRNLATGNDGVIFDNVGSERNQIIYSTKYENVYNTRESAIREALTELGYSAQEIDSTFGTSPGEILGSEQNEILSKIERVVGNHQFADSPFVGEQITREELIQDATTDELEAYGNNALMWALAKRTDVFSNSPKVTPLKLVQQNNLGSEFRWDPDATYEYEVDSSRYKRQSLEANSPEEFQELLYKKNTQGKTKRIYVNRDQPNGGYFDFQTVEAGSHFKIGEKDFVKKVPGKYDGITFDAKSNPSVSIDAQGIDIEYIESADDKSLSSIKETEKGRVLAVLAAKDTKDGIDKYHFKLASVRKSTKGGIEFFDSTIKKKNKYTQKLDNFEVIGKAVMFFPKPEVDIIYQNEGDFLSDPSIGAVVQNYDGMKFTPRQEQHRELEGAYASALRAQQVQEDLLKRKGTKKRISALQKYIDDRVTGEASLPDRNGVIASYLKDNGFEHVLERGVVTASKPHFFSVRNQIQDESIRNAIDSLFTTKERTSESLVDIEKILELAETGQLSNADALVDIAKLDTTFSNIPRGLLYSALKDHPSMGAKLIELADALEFIDGLTLQKGKEGAQIIQVQEKFREIRDLVGLEPVKELQAHVKDAVADTKRSEERAEILHQIDHLAMEAYADLTGRNVVNPNYTDPLTPTQWMNGTPEQQEDYTEAVKNKRVRQSRAKGMVEIPAIKTLPNERVQNEISRSFLEMVREVPLFQKANEQVQVAQNLNLIHDQIQSNTAEHGSHTAMFLQTMKDVFGLDSIAPLDIEVPQSDIPEFYGTRRDYAQRLLNLVVNSDGFKSATRDRTRGDIDEFKEKIMNIYGLPVGEQKVFLVSIRRYMNESFISKDQRIRGKAIAKEKWDAIDQVEKSLPLDKKQKLQNWRDQAQDETMLMLEAAEKGVGVVDIQKRRLQDNIMTNRVTDNAKADTKLTNNGMYHDGTSKAFVNFLLDTMGAPIEFTEYGQSDLFQMSKFPKGMVDITTGQPLVETTVPTDENQLEADRSRRRSYTGSIASLEEHPMLALGMDEQLSNARLGMERFMQSRKRIRVAEPLAAEAGPHLKSPTWKTRAFSAKAGVQQVLSMDKVNRATKYWARALERSPDLLKGMTVQFVDWQDFRKYAVVQEDQISTAIYLPSQNKVLVSDLYYDNPDITPDEQLASVLIHEIIHSPTKLALDIGYAQANGLPLPGKIDSTSAETLGRIYTSLNDVLLPELREKISNTDYVHGLSSVDEMLSELGSSPGFRKLLSQTVLSAETRKKLGISKSWIRTAWDYVKAVFARLFGLETSSETLKFASEQLDIILDTAQVLTPQRVAINHANVRGVGNLNILGGKGAMKLMGEEFSFDWFDGTKRVLLNPRDMRVKMNVVWDNENIYFPEDGQSVEDSKFTTLRNYKVMLTDIIEWPALFQAYPDLQNVSVEVGANTGNNKADYSDNQIRLGKPQDGSSRVIGVREDVEHQYGTDLNLETWSQYGFDDLQLDIASQDAMEDLIHEIQHAVDEIDGNPSGFNQNSFATILPHLQGMKFIEDWQKKVGLENTMPTFDMYLHALMNNFGVFKDAEQRVTKPEQKVALQELTNALRSIHNIRMSARGSNTQYKLYLHKSGEVTSSASENIFSDSENEDFQRSLDEYFELKREGKPARHPALDYKGLLAENAWHIDHKMFGVLRDIFRGTSHHAMFDRDTESILKAITSFSAKNEIPQPDASERVFLEGDIAAANEVVTLLAKTYNNLFSKGMVTQTPEEFIKAYAPGKIGSKKYYSRITKGIDDPGSIRIGDQGRNQVTRVHATNSAIDLISQVLRGRTKKSRGVLDRLDDAETSIKGAEESIEKFNEQFKDVVKKGLASPEEVARGMLVQMKKMTMEEIQKIASKVGKPIRKTAMTMDGLKIRQVESVLSRLVNNNVEVEKLNEQDLNDTIEQLGIEGFSGMSPEDKYRRVALIKTIRTQKDTGMFLYRLAKDKLGEGTSKDRNNLIKDIQNILNAKSENELDSVKYLSIFTKRLDTLRKKKREHFNTEEILKDSIKERDMLKEFYEQVNPRYKRLRAAMGELEPTDIGDGKTITVMRLARDAEGKPTGGYNKESLTIKYDKNGAIENPNFNRTISETLHFARDPRNIKKYGNQPWFKNMSRNAQAALMDPTNGLKDKYFTQRKHWHLGSLESVSHAMSRMGPLGKKISGMITQVLGQTRDLTPQVKAYAMGANRGFVRAQKELGKTGPEIYTEVWQDIAFWFDNHPEYYGKEDTAFTEMWKWLREERPMHFENVKDMNRARDAVKFWVQKEMEARHHMRYVNEEKLGNRIRDDEVTVQSDIDGRNMEFYRRPIDLGFATWSRTLNSDAVSAAVMMMRKAMDEDGQNDSKRQIVLDDLKAASDEKDIAKVIEKLDALYGDEQVVKDFVEPFILSGVRRSAFTGPDDTPVGNSQFASSWKKSGGEMIAFLDDVFDRFADIDELDPDEAEEKRFEWYNDFAKQLHSRYRRLLSANNQINSQAHDILKSSEALKNTPRSLDSRQIESKLPKQFFYYDIHDEVSTQIRLAMMVATSVFGRNGVQINNTGQSFYDKMGERSATFNKIMTQATRGVHDAPRMRYTGAQRKEAYRILKDQYRESDPKSAFERYYSDAVTYREFGKVFDQLGQYYGKGNISGAYGDANVLLELLGVQSLMVLDNPKSSFWQTLALGEFPMAFRGLNRMSGKATGAALKNMFNQSFGGMLEAAHYNLPKTGRIARALNNTHFRVAEMEQGLADHLNMVGPNGEMVNGDRANSMKKAIRKVKNFIAHSRRLNPDGTRQSFDAMTLLTGLFPWANGIINHSVGVGTATAYEAEILRIANHIKDQGLDIFDPIEFTAEDLGMNDSKTAEMIIGERDGWNNMNSLLMESGTSSMSRLAYDYLQRRALDSDAPVLEYNTILMMNQVGMANVSGEGFNAKIPALSNNGLMRYAGIFLGWPIWKMSQTNRFIERPEGDELGTYMAFLKYLGLLSAVYMPLGLSAAFLVDWYDEEIIGKPNNLPPLTPWAMTPVFGPLLAMSNEESTIYALTSRLARAGNVYGMGLEIANSMFASGDPYGAAREFSLDSRLFMFNTFRNLRDALGTWYHQGEADYGNVIRPMLYGLGLGSVIQQMDVVTNLLDIDSEERRVADYLTARNLIKKSAWVMGLQLKPPAKGYGKPSPVSVNLRQMERAAYANDKAEFSEQYNQAIEAAREYIEENKMNKSPEEYVHGRFRQRNIKYGITQGVISDSDWQRILEMQDADDRLMLEEYVELHQYYLNQIGGTPRSRAPSINQLRRMALLGIPIR